MLCRLQVVSTDSEHVLNLTVYPKEPLGVSNGFEPSHLAFLLAGVLMGNLSPVVFILARSMLRRREHLATGGWVAHEFVGDQSVRRFALALQRSAEEPFGGSAVSVLGDKYIDDVAVLIHRFPQVMEPPSDLDEDFVHLPDVTESPLLVP